MDKINVFITVDTEHSIGGAFSNPDLNPVGNKRRIYGQIGEKKYGIPLIMDIADAFELKLSFFLEVFNKYYFDESETREVCQYILNRNHDIQLHIHPNYLNFNCEVPGKLKYSDFISDFTFNRQKELLSEGRDLLVKYGASMPVAFRAGSYGASLSTLKALKETGFLIDSSFNRAYCNETCFIPESDINDLIEMEGIWEFPITNFIENSHIRASRFMPMDLSGVSFQEMKQVLDHSTENGPNNITIILHSFSFIKAFDVQYNKIRPRKTVIKRFEKLCRFLAENSHRFNVMTFGSLNKLSLMKLSEPVCHHYLNMPFLYSVIRGFEQLKDNLI
jgi:hypothetical protein